MRRLLLLLLSIAAGACTAESASNECKNVCQAEAACVERMVDDGKTDEEQNRFDQAECIAACAALERDDAVGKALVERHVTCWKEAGGDCAKLLACQ